MIVETAVPTIIVGTEISFLFQQLLLVKGLFQQILLEQQFQQPFLKNERKT